MVENAPIDIHFEATGYEYSDSILVMGTIVIMFALAILIPLVLLLLSILCCCKKLRDYLKKQLSATVFGRIIVFMDGSLLVITTACWINLY